MTWVVHFTKSTFLITCVRVHFSVMLRNENRAKNPGFIVLGLWCQSVKLLGMYTRRCQFLVILLSCMRDQSCHGIVVPSALYLCMHL